MSPDGSYAGEVLVPFLLAGAGIGITFVTVTVAAMAGVRPAEVGLASGLVNTSRQIGGSLGLAILATTATSRTAHLIGHDSARAALTSGFQRAFVLAGIFAGVGALASALLIPLRRPPRRAAGRGRCPGIGGHMSVNPRLSVLDQSPIPEGSTGADALRNTLDLARLADAARLPPLLGGRAPRQADARRRRARRC